METDIDIDRLRQAAGEATRLLRVLGNPDRLLLLCRLSQGELCVGELENETGIRQPTLSQQLTVLRDEQLVATRRDGRQIFYRIEAPEAVAVMDTLYRLYCGNPMFCSGDEK